MSLLDHALHAGLRPQALPAAGAVVVLGAGGALGSAVLAQALGSAAYAAVRAVVTADIAPALRGFETRTLATLAAGTPADTALLVFDRRRHANGREAAFFHPQPAELPALAQHLRAAGVRHLVVVLPHTTALLPAAFRAGLASLDEHAVAALHFEHLLIVRPTAAAAPLPGLRGPARLARWLLGQLRWLVPQQQQYVRPTTLAAVVVELARRLPRSERGTRIVPAEVAWQAAQSGDVPAFVEAWLQRRTLPPPRVRPARM